MGWTKISVGLTGLLLGERYCAGPASLNVLPEHHHDESLAWRTAKEVAARLVAGVGVDGGGSTSPGTKSPTPRPSLVDVVSLSGRQIAHLAKNVGDRAAEISQRCVVDSGLSEMVSSAAAGAVRGGRGLVERCREEVAEWRRAADRRRYEQMHRKHQPGSQASLLLVPAIRQCSAFRNLILEHRRCPSDLAEVTTPFKVPYAQDTVQDIFLGMGRTRRIIEDRQLLSVFWE